MTDGENAMGSIAMQIKPLVDALSDPTRGRILVLLEFFDDMTASQLAKALDLHVNTVAHHLRVLRATGVLGDPRVVVQNNYVEKYHRVDEGIRQAFNASPQRLDAAMKELPPEQNQRIFVTLMLAAASLFNHQARQLGSMTPDEFQKTIRGRELLTSLTTVDASVAGEIRDELRALIQTKIDPPEKEDAVESHAFILGSFPLIKPGKANR